MKGIDFEESFTQIVSIKVIKMFLANAASQNWTVYQMGEKLHFSMESCMKLFMSVNLNDLWIVIALTMPTIC